MIHDGVEVEALNSTNVVSSILSRIDVIGTVTVLHVLNSLEFCESGIGSDNINRVSAIPQCEFVLIIGGSNNVTDDDSIGNSGCGHLFIAKMQ